MKVHGIIIVANFDEYYEVRLDGVDLRKLPGRLVTWGCETYADPKYNIVLGRLLEVRAVLTPADFRTDGDKGLWDLNKGQGFIRATAELTSEPAMEGVRQKGLGWGGYGVMLETATLGQASKKTAIRSILSGVGCEALYANSHRVFEGEG